MEPFVVRRIGLELVEGGGVAVPAEEVRRGEHGARLQAPVPVDQQRVPLHVQVLLGRSRTRIRPSASIAWRNQSSVSKFSSL